VAKKLYDMRGSQASIYRLVNFDIEGFVHMLFFRILIFASAIYGALLLLSFVTYIPATLVKLFTVVVWILITPQFFESAKLVSMMSTKGLSFGHFSQEHVFLEKSKYGINTTFFDVMPYAVMMLWVLGFLIMLIWWNV
jgi:hypothetical protein